MKDEDPISLPQNNLSTSRIHHRRFLPIIASMPKLQTGKRGHTSSSRTRSSNSTKDHGTNESRSEHPAPNYPVKGALTEYQNRHRRLPSTDIPASDPDARFIKSFKLNPSLAWQRKHLTAMPRNVGLHPTAYQTPFRFDFEKLLLIEEEERQEEARKKRLADSNQKIAREGFFRSARRRASLPPRIDLKTPTFRSFSDSTDVMRKSSPPRTMRDQKWSSALSLTESVDVDIHSMGVHRANNSANNLKLFDLPSLDKKYTMDKATSNSSEMPLNSSDSACGSGSVPFTSSNSLSTHRSEQKPPSLRQRVPKMNGRASLFLQEAAHLYSLMSAVAMASLRADMEGVSSPLVDYVPGQKFPPVNPEEMQIKILVNEEKDEYEDCIDKRSLRSDSGLRRANSSLRFNSENVRIKRNNKLTNIFMFLFGMSRNSRQRTIYNASRPFSVLGGISDAEVEMLRKVRGHSAQHALCCLWLREFITREHLHGSTGGVAPPIVARVYQYISDGTQQYNNCRKTAFTDFPFPHAQLTSFFGSVSVFIFPLLYFTYVNNLYLAVVFNFFTVSCFIGIQEVALELEEPFIRYPNDLPLNNYQAQYNEALISSLYGGFHPDSWGNTDDNGGIFTTNIKAD